MKQHRSLPSSLEPLVGYLDGLAARAPLGDLRSHLEQLQVSLEELRPYVHFGRTYRRNLIAEGEHYELLCICWRSGQRSPIHDHARSTCGLRVMTGVATETTFDDSPCGQIKATGSVDLGAGYIATSRDHQMHQISNLQADGEDLITLHIYSPPLRKMDTYSLMGSEVAEYCPATFEVAYGAGI